MKKVLSLAVMLIFVLGVNAQNISKNRYRSYVDDYFHTKLTVNTLRT